MGTGRDGRPHARRVSRRIGGSHSVDHARGRHAGDRQRRRRARRHRSRARERPDALPRDARDRSPDARDGSPLGRSDADAPGTGRRARARLGAPRHRRARARRRRDPRDGRLLRPPGHDRGRGAQRPHDVDPQLDAGARAQAARANREDRPGLYDVFRELAGAEAKESDINWKPWAIGGGLLVAAAAGAWAWVSWGGPATAAVRAIKGARETT